MLTGRCEASLEGNLGRKGGSGILDGRSMCKGTVVRGRKESQSEPGDWCRDSEWGEAGGARGGQMGQGAHVFPTSDTP